MRTGRVLLVSLLWLGTGLRAEPDEELLYTRADVLEAQTGEVAFRRAYARRLTLPPTAECPEGEFACTEDRTYGQVYSAAFTLESIHGGQASSPVVERIERGQLLLAIDLSPEHRDALEDAWGTVIGSLHVAAFARPQAGLGYLVPPLSFSTLVQSPELAWVCAELDGSYRFDVVFKSELGRTSYTRTRDAADRVCREIARSVDDAAAEVVRTAPAIRAQARREVHLRSASTLAGVTWSDRLAPLPEGVTFDKRRLDGEATGAIWDKPGGKFRGRDGRFNDIERAVLMPAASLDLLEVPMWVTCWRFVTTRETLGRAPLVEREAPVSVVMAVVPIQDPLMDESARLGTALVVPEKRLIENALTSFERVGPLGPPLVEEAFADPESWPAQGDWMIVACRDDGTARYSIAPFPAAAEVANPREACAAILRALG